MISKCQNLKNLKYLILKNHAASIVGQFSVAAYLRDRVFFSTLKDYEADIGYHALKHNLSSTMPN